jgi:hypothetical protein
MVEPFTIYPSGIADRLCRLVIASMEDVRPYLSYIGGSAASGDLLWFEGPRRLGSTEGSALLGWFHGHFSDDTSRIITLDGRRVSVSRPLLDTAIRIAPDSLSLHLPVAIAMENERKARLRLRLARKKSVRAV